MSVPIIDTQPISSAFIIGDSITLSIVAHAGNVGNSLSYQWHKNGVDISGKTSPTLVLSPMIADDAAYYTCTVIDGTETTLSTIATLTLDSIVAHITRNRKAALASISTSTGSSFTPAVIEEERLFLNINGRFPYCLLLKAPIEPEEEDNRKEVVKIQFMVCCFFTYNDEDLTSEEITYKYRNAAADITKAWMIDRSCGGLMEGTKKLGEDQGIAKDNKGNQMYRVDVVFEVVQHFVAAPLADERQHRQDARGEHANRREQRRDCAEEDGQAGVVAPATHALMRLQP